MYNKRKSPVKNEIDFILFLFFITSPLKIRHKLVLQVSIRRRKPLKQ